MHWIEVKPHKYTNGKWIVGRKYDNPYEHMQFVATGIDDLMDAVTDPEITGFLQSDFLHAVDYFKPDDFQI